MAIVAGALAAAAAPSAHASCTTLGSVGTGINEGIAKFMAEAALKNIRESRGLKAAGAISYKCAAGTILTDCHARQRACK
jgi:hypothetical protein